MRSGPKIGKRFTSRMAASSFSEDLLNSSWDSSCSLWPCSFTTTKYSSCWSYRFFLHGRARWWLYRMNMAELKKQHGFVIYAYMAEAHGFASHAYLSFLHSPSWRRQCESFDSQAVRVTFIYFNIFKNDKLIKVPHISLEISCMWIHETKLSI